MLKLVADQDLRELAREIAEDNGKHVEYLTIVEVTYDFLDERFNIHEFSDDELDEIYRKVADLIYEGD